MCSENKMNGLIEDAIINNSSYYRDMKLTVLPDNVKCIKHDYQPWLYMGDWTNYKTAGKPTEHPVYQRSCKTCYKYEFTDSTEYMNKSEKCKPDM